MHSTRGLHAKRKRRWDGVYSDKMMKVYERYVRNAETKQGIARRCVQLGIYRTDKSPLTPAD